MKRLACIFSAFLLWNCSEHVAGGPGSETTNGIAYVGDGAVASYASVAIRSVDYTSSVDSATSALVNADFYADADGRFSFEAPEGKYRLTIVHGGSAYTGLYKTKGDTSIGSINLEPTASLGGFADVPEKCEFVWVGVRGMDVLVRSDSVGRFQLSQLPSNDSLQVYFLRGDNNKVYDDLSVKLEPNEAEVIDLQPDTLKNKIKFVAVADGKVVPFASLAIRKADWRPDSLRVNNTVVEAETFADKNGMFAIDSLKSGNYRVTVTQSGLAYSKVLSAKQIAKLDTLRLDATASISSKVTLRTGQEFLWVGVYGLDLLVKTNNAGSYVLPSVPAKDSLDIYFVMPDSAKSLYAEWKAIAEPYSTKFSNPVMVLQDFEDGIKNWYVNTDPLFKGTTLTPTAKNVADGIVYDSTRKSKVFHGQYKLADDDYAWVLVGTTFEHEMNFSAIDSVVFYAKGDGNIRLSLENYIDDSKSLKAATDWMPLSKTWQRISVNPAELCVGNAKTETCFTSWSGVKYLVKQLHIFPQDGTEFYIDDVTLYGALF